MSAAPRSALVRELADAASAPELPSNADLRSLLACAAAALVALEAAVPASQPLTAAPARGAGPPAAYSKLGNGAWGLRGPSGALMPGARVEVRKRDGVVKTETVGEIVSEADGYRTCTIAPSAKSRGRSGFAPSARGGACATGGNCSSIGSGRSCGGRDCDGY